MATAKIIKLTDNNNKTLLPITDSAYVQHRWSEGANGTTVTSARDAINSLINTVSNLDSASHNKGDDNQHISYDTSTNKKGIMLDGNGGNIKLGTSGLITISYTSNVLTFGTTANNYSHPTNGAAGNQGPSYVAPASTANTTLGHSGKFVIPNFKVDSEGHITAAGTITYQLPASGNTDTKQNVIESSSKYWVDGVTTKLTTSNQALTAVGDGISYIQYGTFYTNKIYAGTSLKVGGKDVATVDQISNVINFKGNWPTTAPSTINKNDAWRIQTESSNWNSTNIKVEVGDIVLALSDSPGTTASNWTVIQNNIDVSSLVTSVKVSSGNTALTASPTTASNGDVTVTFTHETSTAGTTAVTASTKNITNNSASGQQKVITGITVNNYGHVTGYTAANIYSTDTNNDRAFVVANPATATQTNATGNNNGMFINVWAGETAGNTTTTNKHSIKLVGSGKTTVKSSTAGTITIDTSAETLTHNIYAVVGKDADINDTWLTSVLGSSTSSSYFETIS